jgi:hypothetical protein
MPDGDLEISRKMSSLNYELIMMFKRSCMSAMTNYLLMRDMRVGKFQDTVDAVASIRSIYKKFQNRISQGEQFRLGSGTNNEDERFIPVSSLTSKPVIQYGKQLLGLDSADQIQPSPLPRSYPEEPERPHNTKDPSARHVESGSGDGDGSQNMQIDKTSSSLTYFERNLQSQSSSKEMKKKHAETAPDQMYASLDEKLCADFERIRRIIHGDSEHQGLGEIFELDLDVGKVCEKKVISERGDGEKIE